MSTTSSTEVPKKVSEKSKNQKQSNQRRSTRSKKTVNKKRSQNSVKKVPNRPIRDLQTGFVPMAPPKRVIPSHDSMQHVERFGPRMAITHQSSNGDETVNISGELATDRVCCIAQAIVSTACMSGGAAFDNINAAYAYKFIIDYIMDQVAGYAHEYELELAPAVLFDVLDAVTPRVRGKFAYKFSKPTYTINDPTYANMSNTAFGVLSQYSTSGYQMYSCSLTGYTTILGYHAAMDLFNSASEVLDCVSRQSYRQIRPDDSSAFVYIHPDDASSNSYSYKVNGSTVNYSGTLYAAAPIECEWLARLCLGGMNIALNKTSFTIRTLSTPQSIIADRMMCKLRGYSKHRRQVIIKPIDGNDFISVYDRLLARVYSQEGWSNVTTPFNQSGREIAFDDFKVLVYLVLARWCDSWAPVSAGALFEDYDNSFDGRYIGCGSGDFIRRGAPALRSLRVVEEMLSRIHPYERNHRNMVFYPVPIFYTDASASTVPDMFALTASGVVKAVWNWISGLSGTANIAVGSLVSYSTLEERWNSCLTTIQSYIDLSGQLPEDPVNLACCTRIMKSGTGHRPIYISSFKRLPDSVSNVVDRTIIPHFFAAGDTETWYYALTGELFRDSYGGTTVTTSDLIYGACVTAVHQLSGSGDFKSKNNNSGLGNDLVKLLQDAAVNLGRQAALNALQRQLM